MRAALPLVGASSLLLLAGCSSVEKLTGTSTTCVPTNAVGVTYDASNGIRVDNEEICVAPGSQVVFTFSPVPPARAARTKFWGFGNKWLDQRNNQGNPATITLDVPSDDDEKNKRFKYEVHIQGFRKLDPRIVIQ